MSIVGETVKEFYAHDLVYKFDDRKRITFGIVNESYEGSESEEYLGLQKGQILVSWSHSNRKQICKQNRVHLMSRNIMPGDIVRRLEDGKETQRGYCKATKQFATVQIVETDKVIEHVSDNRLWLTKPFEIGDVVCLGDKYGRVQSIDQMIRMQSKCGSIVEVRSSINYNIKDHWNHSLNGVYLGPGYPGQTVVCTPIYLKDAKWIKKSKAMKRKMELAQIFQIQSIDVCLIEVWWYSSPNHTEYAELKDENEMKRLKVVPYSEHLVICDRHLLQIKPNDVLLKKRDWIKKKSIQYLPNQVPNINNKTDMETTIDDDWYTDEEEENAGDLADYCLMRKMSRSTRRKHSPKFSAGNVVAVQILCTDSKATIIWQDGSEERDVPTTELYYSVSLDDHEFFPGEWVLPNNSTKDGKDSDKYGVVQMVNFLERTAVVVWYRERAEGAPCELTDELVSVYDLKKHDTYVFRPGSIVKSKPVEKEMMGRVVDSCPEGYVKVHWLDGKVENRWPQTIEVIPESEDFEFPDDFTASDDDLSEDAFSWETESVESFDGDVSDDIYLQNMASKVDFIRNRINYLREAFRQHNISKNFHFLKDLLCVYDNSRYLDKFLGTSYFSLESKHFQALLLETKKKAKAMGIELRGRLFSKEFVTTATPPTNKAKDAEKENIQKIIKLQHKVNAQIEGTKDSCPPTPESTEPPPNETPHENLCVELALMLKMRMDLVYAEIISRIGGRQALSVLTNATERTFNKPSSSSTTICAPEDLLATPSLQQHHDDITTTNISDDSFNIIDEAPDSHHYYSSKFEAKDLQKFLNALQKEYKLLKESLPSGVWVRSYADRMDLLSLMIRGPAKTPYEDGLFLFDIQLSPDYPRNPPLVHYISYIQEALNPNLYVEGKVCVSLLGTWMGRGSEIWGPNSTLLQLIVSLQGLILVAEPYYNEAGYDKQTQTQQGIENSRIYNEYVILKLVQSMTELLNVAPKVFRNEILAHFKMNSEKMCERLLSYCQDDGVEPDFPLMPVSRGLKLSLKVALNSFKLALNKALSEGQV